MTSQRLPNWPTVSRWQPHRLRRLPDRYFATYLLFLPFLIAFAYRSLIIRSVRPSANLAVLIVASLVLLLLAVYIGLVRQAPLLIVLSLGGSALSTTVLMFATIYWTLSGQPGSCFSTPLTRADSLYFTVATLTTTGYGDLAPVTQTCREIATVQMVAGLVLITAVLAGMGRAVMRSVEITQDPS